MQNLYYIEIGNLIKESPNNYYYKIISHLPDGIKVIEHSKAKGKSKQEFEIKIDELIEGMDDKSYSIEARVYENERDKILLLHEVQLMLLQAQKQELKHIQENLSAQWAEKENHYKDTIKTLEALHP